METFEVRKIMERIRANYQYFRMDADYIVEEWNTRLRDYEFDEVMEQLDIYIKSGNKEIPKITSLTRNLYSKLELEQMNNIEGKFFCKWCGRQHNSIDYMHQCEERCLRLKYISKMTDLFDIDQVPIFGKGAYECSLEELDKGYDRFIVEVIKQEKIQRKLKPLELQGLKAYYEHCLVDKIGGR